jgi:hypothetical protein
LVEEHDAVPPRIEVTPTACAASRARAAVNNECRLAVWTAARLPVDVVAVADVEESVGIRLDRRVRLHAVEGICAPGDVKLERSRRRTP